MIRVVGCRAASDCLLLSAVGHPLLKSPFNMPSHPAMKFQSKTDYFLPDAIKGQALRLAEFLVRGPYDYAMLLTLLGVWNDQFTDGSCKHSLWIAKPQAAADAPPAAPELKLELSKRIAARLAKWKWLNYSEASDETELGFLNFDGSRPKRSLSMAC